MHVDLATHSMSFGGMNKREKACPVVIRLFDGQPEVLGFTHPFAGKQFVKGTIEAGENPLDAAIRELREESGLHTGGPLISLGTHSIGESLQLWHFFKFMSSELPDTWNHQTEDDFGHTFVFFWHPLSKPLDRDWHPIFHEAFAFFAPRCISD
ncbi:NUDIX domain-containing protein [uncultured Roseibium sp.]|uniref:NUDIX hydrolase n=1 Tax=uncultured Roseibium sp. TaxID=1936171 RepID=UPI00261212B9|nr:NUDIX domain-containing protein [uncultured Roseibium sp.]